MRLESVTRRTVRLLRLAKLADVFPTSETLEAAHRFEGSGEFAAKC